MKTLVIGQKYTFWLTDETEVFTLRLHRILPGGQVQFVQPFFGGQPSVYFRVDRSHILRRAS
jgi:hypothetical protein